MIDINIPIDFKSDGCSIPTGFLDKLIGGERYHQFCREHDFLRRHAVIPWLEADWLLARRIFEHGLIGKIRAPLYFIFVVATHPFYSDTEALPDKWRKYYEHYN